MTSWDLLSSLAEAEGLRKLWLFQPDDLGPGPRRPRGNSFPQLHTLDTPSEPLASCMELLRWTSFEEVTGVYIDSSIFTYDHESLQVLEDVSSLISSQCKEPGATLDFC